MIPYPLPTSFEVGLAERTVDILGSDELTHVAMCAVLEGIESPTLAALAGACRAEDPADLREMFERGLGEAGIDRPDERRAAIVVIKQTACDVVQRKVTPGAALFRLHAMFEVLIGDDEGAARLAPLGLTPLRDSVWAWYYGDEDGSGTVREACKQLVVR